MKPEIQKDNLNKDELGSAIEKPARNGNAPLDRIITSTIEKVSSHVFPCLSISDRCLVCHHQYKDYTLRTKIQIYKIIHKL